MSISLPTRIGHTIPKVLDFFEPIVGSRFLDLFEMTLSYFAESIDAGKALLIQQKIEKIQAASKGFRKKALILQGAHDPTQTFPTRAHVEKMSRLAKTHSIHRAIVHSEQDILKLPYDKFDAIWIRAHGNPSAIHLGEKCILNQKSSSKVLAALASRIKKGGRVILESCDAGNGLQTIAKRISLFCLDATVYAPTTTISGIFGLDFDAQGFPHFNDGLLFRGKKVTRMIDGPENKSWFRRALSWPWRLFRKTNPS